MLDELNAEAARLEAEALAAAAANAGSEGAAAMTALVGGVLRGFGEGVQKLYPPDTPPPELPPIGSLSDVSRSGARTLDQPALCA